jgi:hypothetical protein
MPEEYTHQSLHVSTETPTDTLEAKPAYRRSLLYVWSDIQCGHMPLGNPVCMIFEERQSWIGIGS